MVLHTLVLVTKAGQALAAIFQTALVHLIALIVATAMLQPTLQRVNDVSVDGWVQHVMILVSLASKSQWIVVTVSVNLAIVELAVTVSALSMAK